MYSSGSAMKENETYMNSLEGHINQLNSAWQKLAKDSVNSDFIKTLIDIGTNIVKITDNIGGLTPVLLTLLGLIVSIKGQAIGAAAISLLSTIKTIPVVIANFVQNLSLLRQGFLTTSLAAETLSVALGGITIAASVAIMAYNATRKSQENARVASSELSSQYMEEAKELKDLENAYSELSSKTNLTATEQKKLSDTIDTLNTKYGITVDNINEESNAREENIKKIQQEIAEKKRAAATSAEAGIDFKKTGFLGLGGSERDVVTSRQSVSVSAGKGLSSRYDLEANTLVDLQKKMQGYIETLQNKNNKTKEEKKDLTQLLEKYNNLTESVNRYKEGYTQAYKNLKDGIPITTEQANALYQLGFITEDDAMKIQAYNNYSGDQKEAMWGVTQGLLSLNQETQTNTGLTKEQTQEQMNWRKELEYSEANIKDLNTEIDNMQSSYETLSSAINEYNSSGALSIESLQSLLSLNSDYLSALELVNGKLQINKKYEEAHKQILQQDTLALIENAAMEDLKAQATGTAGQIAESAGAKIKAAGLDGKEAGEYAKEGVSGFVELSGAMAQAGMVDLSAVDVEKWASKWAGITKTVTSMISGVNLTSKKFTSSTSKASKTAKKSSEEYKATIDTLYKYENALDNAKEEVDRLSDAVGNTDNYEEQVKYINQLIEALNNQIAKTNDLKNAQANQIQDYINQLRNQGFAIDYNSDKNELLINNMEHLADFSGDTAKSLEKIINKIQSLNDNNRTLDNSVRSLTSNVKKYYDQLADIPEEKLKKFNELMNDFQQSQLDAVQDQIDDLQHALDNDERLKALEAEIEALEKQNDTIDKQKEMEEKLLAVEEARQKLENARAQRTLLVYSAEKGWSYETDPSAIKDAEDELKDAQDALNEQLKNDELDRLKEQKENIENSYQDQIDKLQNFLDEQNYLIDKSNREAIQSFDDLISKMKEYGLNSAENLKIATDWWKKYQQALAQTKQATDTLSNNGLIYSSATQDKISQAMSSMNPQSTIVPVSTNSSYDKLGLTAGGQTIYISNIELPNVSNANEFVEALKDLPRLATTQSSQRK